MQMAIKGWENFPVAPGRPVILHKKHAGKQQNFVQFDERKI